VVDDDRCPSRDLRVFAGAEIKLSPALDPGELTIADGLEIRFIDTGNPNDVPIAHDERCAHHRRRRPLRGPPLVSVKPFTDAMPATCAPTIKSPRETGACSTSRSRSGGERTLKCGPEIISWLDTRS
jgi:hypothetical protein